MKTSLSRRQWLGGAAAAGALAHLPAFGAPDVVWPPAQSDGRTPRICLGTGAGDDAALKTIKQIGVDYVLMGGPKSPWTEEDLRTRMDRFKAAGLTVINMMIGGIDDVIWGRSRAQEQTGNVIKSIRAAGKVGLPVIEYNFYAYRLMEGYKEELGRGGAGYTAYDYEISKNLPAKDEVGTHTRKDQLKRADAS